MSVRLRFQKILLELDDLDREVSQQDPFQIRLTNDASDVGHIIMLVTIFRY